MAPLLLLVLLLLSQLLRLHGYWTGDSTISPYSILYYLLLILSSLLHSILSFSYLFLLPLLFPPIVPTILCSSVPSFSPLFFHHSFSPLFFLPAIFSSFFSPPHPYLILPPRLSFFSFLFCCHLPTLLFSPSFLSTLPSPYYLTAYRCICVLTR